LVNLYHKAEHLQAIDTRHPSSIKFHVKVCGISGQFKSNMASLKFIRYCELHSS